MAWGNYVHPLIPFREGFKAGYFMNIVNGHDMMPQGQNGKNFRDIGKGGPILFSFLVFKRFLEMKSVNIS